MYMPRFLLAPAMGMLGLLRLERAIRVEAVRVVVVRAWAPVDTLLVV